MVDVSEYAEGAKAPVDWVAIEMDYRAGVKPLRQIGNDHGVSHVAVSKRAKRDGWTRDLRAQIRAKAEAKVSKAAVNSEVNTQRAVTEQAVVEANADLQYKIRIEHRADIGRSRALFRNLLTEIEAETHNLELFQGLGELMDTSGPDATGTFRKDKLNELYQKVISSVGRVDASKKLIEMLEKLIKMERQAFGISDGEEEKSNIEELLKGIQNL